MHYSISVGQIASRSYLRLACASALGAVLIGFPTLALDQPSLPRPEDIIRRAIERSKAWKAKDENERKGLSYNQRVVTDKLQPDGSLKEREEKVYQVAPVKGEPTPKLIEKNGNPPSSSDLKEEAAHRKKQQEASKKRSDSENSIELNEELAGRYDFKMLAEDEVGGRPAYVLSFKPKSQNLPVRRKIDYALNRLSGKVWVDTEDFEITKGEMHVNGSAQIWWGLVASLRQFSLVFEQTRLPDGCWWLKHFDMTVDIRYLFTSVHQKQEAWLSDFK